ncbi:unnamed protein product [Microthlaspi erraticum]|uniref:Uncharacterized protein n=1 Tax=Microthlaspi erraticum TaxID=1685480 RepID=A0A6D2KZW7_9BRAS|nr:unnamed protein product [Microthlaspi erraticum]
MRNEKGNRENEGEERKKRKDDWVDVADCGGGDDPMLQLGRTELKIVPDVSSHGFSFTAPRRCRRSSPHVSPLTS